MPNTLIILLLFESVHTKRCHVSLMLTTMQHGNLLSQINIMLVSDQNLDLPVWCTMHLIGGVHRFMHGMMIANKSIAHIVNHRAIADVEGSSWPNCRIPGGVIGCWHGASAIACLSIPPPPPPPPHPPPTPAPTHTHTHTPPPTHTLLIYNQGCYAPGH